MGSSALDCRRAELPAMMQKNGCGFRHPHRGQLCPIFRSCVLHSNFSINSNSCTAQQITMDVSIACGSNPNLPPQYSVASAKDVLRKQQHRRDRHQLAPRAIVSSAPRHPITRSELRTHSSPRRRSLLNLPKPSSLLQTTPGEANASQHCAEAVHNAAFAGAL